MKPTVIVDLSGPDGNVFALLGIVKREISKEDGERLTKEVTNAKSYIEALNIMNNYVEILI